MHSIGHAGSDPDRVHINFFDSIVFLFDLVDDCAHKLHQIKLAPGLDADDGVAASLDQGRPVGAVAGYVNAVDQWGGQHALNVAGDGGLDQRRLDQALAVIQGELAKDADAKGIAFFAISGRHVRDEVGRHQRVVHAADMPRSPAIG